MTHKSTTSVYFILTILAIVRGQVIGYNYLTDFPGKYCESLPGHGCCDKRKDDCSVPISSKLNQNKCYYYKFVCIFIFYKRFSYFMLLR